MSGRGGNGCKICPRACGVDRREAVGACGAGYYARVAKTVDPFCYEEPCLGDLGAVFFCGCSLRCSYCQNIAISRGGAAGEEYTDERLADLFDRMTEENRAVDLVTPTHYLDRIECAVSLCKIKPRIVYNTSGYETEQAVKRAAAFTDVFLTDFKYGDCDTAARLSAARDYPSVALRALEAMRDAVPDSWEERESGKILKRGLIVRHLVLPGETRNSLAVLDMIKSAVGADVTISLMSQFTPNGKGGPSRRLKKLEYKIVCEHALKLGFRNGYFQDLDSASSAYTPVF